MMKREFITRILPFLLSAAMFATSCCPLCLMDTFQNMYIGFFQNPRWIKFFKNSCTRYYLEV